VRKYIRKNDEREWGETVCKMMRVGGGKKVNKWCVTIYVCAGREKVGVSVCKVSGLRDKRVRDETQTRVGCVKREWGVERDFLDYPNEETWVLRNAGGAKRKFSLLAKVIYYID